MPGKEEKKRWWQSSSGVKPTNSRVEKTTYGAHPKSDDDPSYLDASLTGHKESVKPGADGTYYENQFGRDD